MDKQTRTDLLGVVEQLKGQISNLEQKLQSVVSAYKSLKTEKDALQSTVTALNSTRQNEPSSRSVDGIDGEDDQSEGSGSNNNGQDQVRALSNTLSTLMEEKKKLEMAYQAERKAMKLSYEDKITGLRAELEAVQNRCDSVHEQNKEVRVKLRNQQMDHERDQSDQAAIMRELQVRMTSERSAKEDLEHQLEDMRRELAVHANRKRQGEAAGVPSASIGGHESSGGLKGHGEECERGPFSQMNDELVTLRQRLKEAENKASQPSPMLLRLQKQLQDMKEEHESSIVRERVRADEAVARVGRADTQYEERAAQLENRLGELSQMVGDYERTRRSDQQAIQKLKERVEQLDTENTNLVRVSHQQQQSSPAKVRSNKDDEADTNTQMDEEIETLTEALLEIRRSLVHAAQKANRPLNIYDIFSQDGEEDEEEEMIHRRCRDDLSALKDEFEKYKLRAQSVLKSRTTTKEGAGANKEADTLRTQLAEQRERVRSLLAAARKADEAASESSAELRRALADAQSGRDARLAAARADYEKKAVELERRLQRQRERTVDMLAEKDREIAALGRSMSSLTAASEGRNVTLMGSTGGSSASGLVGVDGYSGVGHSLGEDGVSSASLRQGEEGGPERSLSPTLPSTGGPLLHRTEEKARMEGEAVSLRRRKHELEAQLRSLQREIAERETERRSEVKLLKEAAQMAERSRSRESVNVEYVKNVVYAYTVCDQYASKERMLGALATALHFSPKERDTAMKHLSGWWKYYSQ